MFDRGEDERYSKQYLALGPRIQDMFTLVPIQHCCKENIQILLLLFSCKVVSQMSRILHYTSRGNRLYAKEALVTLGSIADTIVVCTIEESRMPSK